jgi:hypothetical protein
MALFAEHFECKFSESWGMCSSKDRCNGVNQRECSSATQHDNSDNRNSFKFKYHRAVFLSVSRSKVRNIHNAHEAWSKRSTKRSQPSAFISQFNLFRWLLVGSRYQHFARHWPISFWSVSAHYNTTWNSNQILSNLSKGKSCNHRDRKNAGTSLRWCL